MTCPITVINSMVLSQKAQFVLKNVDICWGIYFKAPKLHNSAYNHFTRCTTTFHSYASIHCVTSKCKYMFMMSNADKTCTVHIPAKDQSTVKTFLMTKLAFILMLSTKLHQNVKNICFIGSYRTDIGNICKVGISNG